jgi:enolase
MPAPTIAAIDALEILDCRGNPTLRVSVTDSEGRRSWADVPAGKSTGSREASELRDGGSRYGGQGVRKAGAAIRETIAPALAGRPVIDQAGIDRAMIELDGTATKSRLGGNAIVGVSLAVLRAGAAAAGMPVYRYLSPSARVLPVPLVNLINGGKHASNDLEFQEFCIFPVGARSLAEAMEISYAVNRVLYELVTKKFGLVAGNTGDEGGYAPPMSSVRDALDFLMQAVRDAGVTSEILLGLDCAATHLYDPATRTYGLEGKRLRTGELAEYYRALIAAYPIASIEDPFAEDDHDGFELAAAFGIQIVGDDLFCTNPAIIRERLGRPTADALLWKVNQIGTVTEALEAAELAYRNGLAVMVSERSGDTEDGIIADIVVGLNAGQIKTGAPVRGERTAKYNRLLEIEHELGATARYAGRGFRIPA